MKRGRRSPHDTLQGRGPQVGPGAKQPFWFVIRAKNGRTVATSETYMEKASCKKTACGVAAAFTDMARVVDKTGE